MCLHMSCDIATSSWIIPQSFGFGLIALTDTRFEPTRFLRILCDIRSGHVISTSDALRSHLTKFDFYLAMV